MVRRSVRYSLNPRSSLYSLPRLFLFILALGLAACSEPRPEVQMLSGPTMGTQYHVSWVDTPENTADAESLQEMIRSAKQAKISANMKFMNDNGMHLSLREPGS